VSLALLSAKSKVEAKEKLKPWHITGLPKRICFDIGNHT